MNASWSAEQREWLQAMGYDLLVPADAAGLDTVPSDVVAVPPAPRAAPPAAPETPVRAPASRAGPAGAPDLTDPLMRALLRASRCDDLDALARLAGDLRALRRDPAAKRALWPELRALRVRSRR